jgi:rhodanese-related sulfurtransferase
VVLLWLALTIPACAREDAPARPPVEGAPDSPWATSEETSASRETEASPRPASQPSTEAASVGARVDGSGTEGAPGSASAGFVRAPKMDGDVVLIEVSEVKEKLASGIPLILIDTRKRFEFDQEHIPGAISIPLTNMAAAGELPGIARNHEIIVYCLAETCPSSKNAARLLARFGYTNVREMRAGLVGWKNAGYETSRR